MRKNRIFTDYEISIFGKHKISADIYCGYLDSPNRPCILFLHGGGFVGGDKRQFAGMAAYLSLGLNAVCISVNYRTAPQSLFPAPVVDCLGVCGWVNENREKLNIGNTYLVGGSPGANIAAMAMVSGKKILEDEGIRNVKTPRNAVLLNPILNMDLFYQNNQAERNSVDQYLGQDSPELRKRASPLFYPQGGLSFLVLQGADDRIVGDAALKEMKKQFTGAGSRITIKEYRNESHGWFNDSAKMTGVVHAIEHFVCEKEGKN